MIASLPSQPAWLAALGVITLVSFLLVNVLSSSSAKSPASMIVARPPTLADLDDVVLKGGYTKELPFSVERRDCMEVLSIRVEGLPEMLKAPPLTLSASEDTASLTLLNPLASGSSQQEARISLWQGDDKIDEKMFHLTIQNVPRPLLKGPDRIDCLAGEKAVYVFPVERRNCRELLQVRLEGLPPEVRQESTPADDPDSPSVKLTLTANLAPQIIPLKLFLYFGDVVADSKTLLLKIQQPASPSERPMAERVRLHDKTPQRLAVEAGTKAKLQVFLDRGGYRGEVQVRLEGLPEGVAARPTAVAAGTDRVAVSFAITRQTRHGEYDLTVLVCRNEKTIAERALTLSVEQPRSRQESVHFPTVDQAELAGTLYHGWKGKKGMTVLMLHDLGQHRNTPGWRHLAEALQAEGHTVLTFDFRSHGNSHKVAAKFWRHGVNKYLPVRPEDKEANYLKTDHLPTKYVAWLIEDIAAARTYLDLRHDEPNGPVNTFNLVVIGAGQASALGSLWLATEGLRFNAADVGDKIVLKPPEKLSVRQAVWIGVKDPLKLNPVGVYSWLRDAHAKPEVPITFIYGEDDFDTSTLLRNAIRKKLGKALVLPGTRESGQQLLDQNARTAIRIKHYLVKTLAALPPVAGVPRNLKSLHSYWALPAAKMPGMRLFVTAKHPGETVLSAVPMRPLGIPIEGCAKVTGILQKLREP